MLSHFSCILVQLKPSYFKSYGAVGTMRKISSLGQQVISSPGMISCYRCKFCNGAKFKLDPPYLPDEHAAPALGNDATVATLAVEVDSTEERVRRPCVMTNLENTLQNAK